MKVGLRKQIEIVSLMPRRGKIRLEMPFGASYSVPALTEAQLQQLASLAARQTKSLQTGGDDLDPTLTFDQVNPQESDFIYPMFRALDAGLIEDYWIDFSGAGVVEKATSLFLNQTVYKNHIFWNVENWLGAVSRAVWDPSGAKVSTGKPGVNVELKIDWKSNPKIARGLLMQPPAIHSVSATVDFDWDASHPDLLEQGIFWRNLGQEINGSIVRLIVTAIRRIYEISLVWQGANAGSNNPLEPDDEETGLSALPGSSPTAGTFGTKETKKVKLTAEQKKALGLGAHEGEEVQDSVVMAAFETALSSLTAREAAATAIVDADRAEVLRLASLAEGIGEDKKLPDAVALMIGKADAAQLPGLKVHFAAKAEAQFPKTCQSCGAKNSLAGRSSVEDAPVVPAAAAQAKRTALL